MSGWFYTTAVGIGGDDRGMFGRCGIGGVGGRQSDNLRSCGNFWLVVVIVLVVVLKLTHIKLLFGFSTQK